jgi:hypothetical protein
MSDHAACSACRPHSAARPTSPPAYQVDAGPRRKGCRADSPLGRVGRSDTTVFHVDNRAERCNLTWAESGLPLPPPAADRGGRRIGQDAPPAGWTSVVVGQQEPGNLDQEPRVPPRKESAVESPPKGRAAPPSRVVLGRDDEPPFIPETASGLAVPVVGPPDIAGRTLRPGGR